MKIKSITAFCLFGLFLCSCNREELPERTANQDTVLHAGLHICFDQLIGLFGHRICSISASFAAFLRLQYTSEPFSCQFFSLLAANRARSSGAYAMHSASRQTGRAAKKSAAECCLMNMVDKQISTTEIITNTFHQTLAPFSFSHTDPIPME